MKEPEKIGIYSNSMNKLDVLHFNSDSLLYVKTLHFPLWNKQRGIPKAYTRLIQYNDSLFIGTSFYAQRNFGGTYESKNRKSSE